MNFRTIIDHGVCCELRMDQCSARACESEHSPLHQQKEMLIFIANWMPHIRMLIVELPEMFICGPISLQNAERKAEVRCEDGASRQTDEQGQIPTGHSTEYCFINVHLQRIAL